MGARRLAVPLACVAALACQSRDHDKPKPTPPPPAADGGIKVTNPHGTPAPEIVVPPTDWASCDAALEAAATAPAMRRAQQIVNGCRVCGEWKPLLDWNTLTKDGGPKRHEIEQAMLACKGYCNPDAKQRFLGTLDTMRGKGTRGPWRFLGEICKAGVSARPDNRYAGAPYFALDRIARAAAARPESAKLLDQIDLPMPVISISGFGYDLARSAVTAPDVGPFTLTVTPKEIRVAVVPRAKLGKDGVTLGYRGDPYPGALVKSSKELAEAIQKITSDGKAPVLDPGANIALFAPRAMPAVRLLDVFKLTGERPGKPGPKVQHPIKGDLRLAVAADGGLPGWATSGSIPIALRTTPNAESVKVELGDNADAAIEELKKQKDKLIAIIKKLKERPADPGMPSPLVLYPALVVSLAPTAKVEDLAKLLGAAGYFDIKSVALTLGAGKPRP